MLIQMDRNVYSCILFIRAQHTRIAGTKLLNSLERATSMFYHHNQKKK